MAQVRSVVFFFLLGVFCVGGGWWAARASDHDDGESGLKVRNLNLTDLFVFREDWHSGNSADKGNLIFVLNSNPRSLPTQQYYFSTTGRYELHVRRVTDRTLPYNGTEDATLRFSFGPPDTTTHAQAISVTAVIDGMTYTTTATSGGGVILTTPYGGAEMLNAVPIGGATFTVFAGLKEDPFFFDVEQFFKVRAGIASSNGVNLGPGFRAAAAASDFAAGYNVNAIVARVPISVLSGPPGSTIFDVWSTISIPQ